jgi:hypothetical protein
MGNWWRSQSRTTRDTLFVLIIIALVSAVAGAWLAGAWDVLVLDLGIEFGGAIVTFILIEQILARNEERKMLNCRVAPRIRSRVNAVALEAVDQLRREGWLFDGSLRGAYLSGANLAGADLQDASLQNALLIAANLEDTQLINTNLRGAHLGRANLRGATLLGTNLFDANLEDAVLGGATFDTHTMLPDGTYWKPDTDMKRFTDPAHPDAWQPQNPQSPRPVELMEVPWGKDDGRSGDDV